MSLYVYRPQSSSSARLLAEALNARRVKDWHRLRHAAAGRLICWGAAAPNVGFPADHILNGAAVRSKFHDAEALRAAGVPTVEVSRMRPVQQPAVPLLRPADPAADIIQRAQELAAEFAQVSFAAYTRPAPMPTGAEQLRNALGEVITALQVAPPAQPAAPPVVPQGEWFARTSNHVGGQDLLQGLQHGDYYVKKETLNAEFRVHSFLGRSIRAGKKVTRDVAPSAVHAWIRSWDGGWKISYDGDSVRQAHRDLAHRAVAALNLQFGAVDIGQKADGSLLVLEVNRAPGLEGGTIEAYRRAISAWAGA